MKKVIAFAGSNSKTSINKALVTYAASLVSNATVEILDLNDFELPIYSPEIEKESGIPENAKQFLEGIRAADGILLSLAEHNGTYSAVFKNLFDWMSRIEAKTFLGTPMLLMATSPGARGGLSVLNAAQDRFPRHNASVVEVFSLPSFGNHFSEGKITDNSLHQELSGKIKTFENSL
jgi:NAD(P)H-dependent FMN reductase